MGRKQKKGLASFPLDTDMFHDVKVRKLIRRQSGKAVAVYTLLLCNIYRQGYYMRWDQEMPFVLSEILGFDEAFIQAAVECCLSLGLFNKLLFEAEHVLSSKAIQERYLRIVDRRNVTVQEYSLLDTYLSFNQLHRENMLISDIWLTQLSIRFKITVDAVKTYIYEFFEDCDMRGKHHTDTPEAKQHFYSWLKMKFDKKKQKNDLLSARKTKRAASKTVAAQLSEYQTSF